MDQKSVLVQKGFEPAVHDFELLNLNYEDMTFDILESEEPVTLLMMDRALERLAVLWHRNLRKRFFR